MLLLCRCTLPFLAGWIALSVCLSIESSACGTGANERVYRATTEERRRKGRGCGRYDSEAEGTWGYIDTAGYGLPWILCIYIDSLHGQAPNHSSSILAS